MNVLGKELKLKAFKYRIVDNSFEILKEKSLSIYINNAQLKHNVTYLIVDMNNFSCKLVGNSFKPTP